MIGQFKLNFFWGNGEEWVMENVVPFYVSPKMVLIHYTWSLVSITIDILCQFQFNTKTRLSHTHKSRSVSDVSRIKTVFQWKENIPLKIQCKAQFSFLGWIPSYTFWEIQKSENFPTDSHPQKHLLVYLQHSHTWISS